MSIQPALFDVTVYRGTTLDIICEVDGLDLTGADASTECALPLACSVDAMAGTIRLRLTPSQTASAAAGEYPYELYVMIGADVHMLMMGRITISDGVV